MVASEVEKAMHDHIEQHGDCDIQISVLKQDDIPEKFKDQQYLTSEPSFIVPEENDEGWVISIRDWPY
jgi:hypothetical protein